MATCHSCNESPVKTPTAVELSSHEKRPEDIGILGIEIYFPNTYVLQEDLERWDHVSPGRYTIGLGQAAMAFCSDREDVVSMGLTAVKRLMDRMNIDYKSIGRLEVGTETLIDKAKSVKSCLMSLFEEHGHTEIEGVDLKSACYGGTAAIFNTVAWIESRSYESASGPLGLVVMSDIAMYEKGSPGRPTGGCGALAILIGPHAPLVIDTTVKSTLMKNTFDFYKPIMDSEYPIVHGQLSLHTYLSAFSDTYSRYLEKSFTQDREHTMYCVFHSPFTKLTQKAFARKCRIDCETQRKHRKTSLLNTGDSSQPSLCEKNAHLINIEFTKNEQVELTDLYSATDAAFETPEKDKTFDAFWNKIAQKPELQKYLAPSLLYGQQLGNLYCGSLYAGLLSLLAQLGDTLVGQRVGLFSYGSGMASTFFTILVKKPFYHELQLDVERMTRNLLHDRIQMEPSHLDAALVCRDKIMSFVSTKAQKVSVKPLENNNGHAEKRDENFIYNPVGSVETISSNSFYIDYIDHQYQRHYLMK